MTKTQIKQKINKLKDFKENLLSMNVPEAIDIKKQIQEHKDIINKLGVEWQNKSASQILSLKQEIQLLEKEYEALIEESKPKLTEILMKWEKNIQNSMDWGYAEPCITHIMANGRFVILKVPGTIAGQGTPMGSGGYYYARTEHKLVDTEQQSYFKCVLASVEGRLSKNQLNKWHELVFEHYKRNEKDTSWLKTEASKIWLNYSKKEE